MLERELIVNTPQGLLRAHPANDPNHPGIIIDLYPNNDLTEQPIRLAMTEYTEFEALCSYVPHDPSIMLRELKEVPREQIMRVNGDELRPDETPSVQTSSMYKVKPGLVTRTWQSEKADSETYHRTFHTM